MEVFKIILLVVLIGFVAWLVIDTIMYVVKKVKNKKLKKQMSVEKQEDTTNENESN